MLLRVFLRLFFRTAYFKALQNIDDKSADQFAFFSHGWGGSESLVALTIFLYRQHYFDISILIFFLPMNS